VRAKGAAVLLAALLLPVAIPEAVAQLPSASAPLVQVILSAELGAITVPRLGKSEVTLRIEDLTQVTPGNTLPSHATTLTARILGEETDGWAATTGPGTVYTQPGETALATLSVLAGATVKNPYVSVRVHALTQAIDPSSGNVFATYESEDVVFVQLEPYYQGLALIHATPQRVGPYEIVTYPVTVTNAGPYPDTFTLRAFASKPGYLVSIVPRVTLFPGETREVPLQVVTPKDQLFFGGEAATISVELSSANDPSFVFPTSTVVSVEGFYVPGYWWPLVLLGAILAGHAAHRGFDRAQRRRLEEGRPPRGLTEAETLELEALRLSEPAAYEARRAELLQTRRARWQVWREQRAKRRAILAAMRAKQREERRILRAQANEQKRILAQAEYERRLLEKARAKVARQKERELARERAAAAKVAAKESAVRRKIDAREQKALAKERARLEKERAALEAKLLKERARKAAELEKQRRKLLKRLKKEGRAPPDDESGSPPS